MSNFLFALIDGGGAVPPALSVAGALVRNGHDVRVLGDPVLRAEVEAVGARHIDWTTAPLRHERSKDADIVADWQARTPLGAMARTRDGFMVGPAAEYAQDTLDELARYPADAVVSEMLCMGAMLGGQAAGVPVAALITTVLPLPVPGRPPFGPGFMPARGALGRARDAAVARLSSAMWNKALPKLNATRAQHGLPAFQHVFEQLAGVDRILVLTSEAFEFPGGPLPPNVRYVGPRLDDPEWVEEWTPPAGDDPLVLVGMSSTYQDHVSMLRRVATGLGELPVRGLVTTGPTVAPEDIDAPPNVTVVRSAPHSRVLEHASAVVTHAGHGTVIKALGARGAGGGNADRPRPARRGRARRGIGGGPAAAAGIVLGEDRRGGGTCGERAGLLGCRVTDGGRDPARHRRGSGRRGAGGPGGRSQQGRL